MADSTEYATPAPDDARSRLEMVVELLRREWRDGCPAGMAYQTALGIVHQLRQNAAIDPTERSRRPIPIQTKRYIGAERHAAYTLVREEVAKGHQVFVICPLVEEAVEEAERLSQWVFPDLRIATLHGGMKSRDKDAVMTDFRHRHYDVLVAASVIELRIDNPNATVMLIEGADRFGLAQLHQFRWWLARGGVQSYCVLIADEGSPDSEQRLETMVVTDDVFLLAKKGLELGGPATSLTHDKAGLATRSSPNLPP
jgi:ATP-dependent DNA helicase RecG